MTTGTQANDDELESDFDGIVPGVQANEDVNGAEPGPNPFLGSVKANDQVDAGGGARCEYPLV